MIRRALVALDDTRRAAGVFRRAVEIARWSGAELILFRAVAVPQEFPAAAAGGPADELKAKMVRAAHEELMRFVASVPTLSSRVVVRIDLSPEHALLAAADDHDVDLIVIGNHGYHGMDRILGTTAGHVVYRAKRDVFIVYRGEEDAG